MAHKVGNESDNDEVRNQMTSQETVSIEEVRALRQQMADMYDAWTSGQAPPSSIRDYLNTNMTPSIQVSTNDPIYPRGEMELRMNSPLLENHMLACFKN
ncbi:hypothetical protein KY289_008484 [Solanum tuberosum]|nr:hypothetical protein KY289_008484 [Solanum tuberosum]